MWLHGNIFLYFFFFLCVWSFLNIAIISCSQFVLQQSDGRQLTKIFVSQMAKKYISKLSNWIVIIWYSSI